MFDSHFWTIVIVMFVAGAFGGVVNYYLNRESGQDKVILQCIFIGIGASFLVPLFLNMISSDLLEATKTNSLSLLVFSGFCLIASMSSGAFIRTLADRILSEAKQAKKEAEEVRKEIVNVQSSVYPLVDKEIEHADLNDSECSLEIATSEIDENMKKVMRSLTSSKFSFRSLRGIQKETDIEERDMPKILSQLDSMGLSDKIIRKNTCYWYITEKGRRVLATAK